MKHTTNSLFRIILVTHLQADRMGSIQIDVLNVVGQEEHIESGWILNPLKRLASMFTAVGIYTKNEGRRKFLDVVARVYCAIISVLIMLLGIAAFADILMSNVCISMVLFKVAKVSLVFYSLLVSLLWNQINSKCHVLCSAIERAHVGIKAKISQRLDSMVSVLQVVFSLLFALVIVWTYYSITHDHCFIYLFQGGLPITAHDCLIDHPNVPIWLIQVQTMIGHLFSFYVKLTTFLLIITFILWCYILLNMLNKFNSLIESMVVKQPLIDKDTLVQLQKGFEKCLKAVIEANGTFGVFVGLTTFCSVSFLCLIIYLSATTNQHTDILLNTLLALLAIFATTSIAPMIVNRNVSHIFVVN